MVHTSNITRELRRQDVKTALGHWLGDSLTWPLQTLRKSVLVVKRFYITMQPLKLFHRISCRYEMDRKYDCVVFYFSYYISYSLPDLHASTSITVSMSLLSQPNTYFTLCTSSPYMSALAFILLVPIRFFILYQSYIQVPPPPSLLFPPWVAWASPICSVCLTLCKTGTNELVY